jgi:ribosomal protein S27AE
MERSERKRCERCGGWLAERGEDYGLDPVCLCMDDGFTCPRCGMTSHNPNDKRQGYCPNCHDWTEFDQLSQEDL